MRSSTALAGLLAFLPWQPSINGLGGRIVLMTPELPEAAVDGSSTSTFGRRPHATATAAGGVAAAPPALSTGRPATAPRPSALGAVGYGLRRATSRFVAHRMLLLRLLATPRVLPGWGTFQCPPWQWSVSSSGQSDSLSNVRSSVGRWDLNPATLRFWRPLLSASRATLPSRLAGKTRPSPGQPTTPGSPTRAPPFGDRTK